MQQKHQQEPYDYLFKIILVGDSCVGKTCLLSRWIKNQVSEQLVSTIGVEFATKVIELGNGKLVKAQIWDTAGQERYRAITQAHYRQAEGALLMYNICDLNTFKNSEMWLKELKQQAEEDCVITLVGNKLDLADQRQVSTQEAQKWSKERNIQFQETSALTGENVSQAFLNLLESIYGTKVINGLDQQNSDKEELHISYNLLQKSINQSRIQEKSSCCQIL